jgi:hypothetical protein
MDSNHEVTEIPEKYANDPAFQEFLNREFDKTATNATMEELAEFALGSIETAITAFEEDDDS